MQFFCTNHEKTWNNLKQRLKNAKKECQNAFISCFSCQNAFISYFSWIKIIFNLYFKTSNPILRVTRDQIKWVKWVKLHVYL